MSTCVVCKSNCIRVNLVELVPKYMWFIDENYRDITDKNPLCCDCGDVLESLGHAADIYPFTETLRRDDYPETNININNRKYNLKFEKPGAWSNGSDYVTARIVLTCIPLPSQQ
jgi:hypothetical protein